MRITRMPYVAGSIAVHDKNADRKQMRVKEKVKLPREKLKIRYMAHEEELSLKLLILIRIS